MPCRGCLQRLNRSCCPAPPPHSGFSLTLTPSFCPCNSKWVVLSNEHMRKDYGQDRRVLFLSHLPGPEIFSPMHPLGGRFCPFQTGG